MHKQILGINRNISILLQDTSYYYYPYIIEMQTGVIYIIIYLSS